MKGMKNTACIPVLLICAVLFAGYTPAELSLSEDIPQTDAEYTQLGPVLMVEKMDCLELLDAKDVLSADGLFYGTWGSGELHSYEDEDGNEIQIRDVQLFALVSEKENPEQAAAETDNLLYTARETYHVTEEKQVEIDGREFTCLVYDNEGIRKNAHYARGISAFKTEGNCALCIELTSQKEWDKDMEPLLKEFLEHCRFSG